MFEYNMNRVLLEQVTKMRVAQTPENPPKDAEYLLHCIKYDQDFGFNRAKYLPKLFGTLGDSFVGASYEDYLVSANEFIKLALYQDPYDESDLTLKIATDGLVSSAALAVWCIFAELHTAARTINVPYARYNEYLPLIRVPGVDNKHMMKSLYFYQYIIEQNYPTYTKEKESSFYQMPYPNFKRVMSLSDLSDLASRFSSVYTVGQPLNEGQLNFVLNIQNITN